MPGAVRRVGLKLPVVRIIEDLLKQIWTTPADLDSRKPGLGCGSLRHVWDIRFFTALPSALLRRHLPQALWPFAAVPGITAAFQPP